MVAYLEVRATSCMYILMAWRSTKRIRDVQRCNEVENWRKKKFSHVLEKSEIYQFPTFFSICSLSTCKINFCDWEWKGSKSTFFFDFFLRNFGQEVLLLSICGVLSTKCIFALASYWPSAIDFELNFIKLVWFQFFFQKYRHRNWIFSKMGDFNNHFLWKKWPQSNQRNSNFHDYWHG